MKLPSVSFALLFFLSFLAQGLSQSTPPQEAPVAKAFPADCHAADEKPKKKEQKSDPETKTEKKKSNDFQVNLYKQQAQLRKTGGTPQTPRQRSIERRKLPTPKFSWKVDETKPISKLVIKLEEQRLYGFQGAEMVMSSDISSGKEAYATKKGSYKVLQKSIAHKSNLYGSFVNAKGVIVNANANAGDPVPPGLKYVPSPMPFFLRLSHQGLGLHEGILPGYPASHGCVRLPPFIAEKLFASVNLGTEVEIFP